MLPKDVKALIHTGAEHGYRMRVIEAVESVNERQKSIVYDKLSAFFGDDLRGKRIALWGLAFKPETDDMREAPALVVIDKLVEAGAEVVVYASCGNGRMPPAHRQPCGIRARHV